MLPRWVLLFAATLWAGLVLAQPPAAQPARIGWVAEHQGELLVRGERVGTWQAAPRNRPVKEGDEFSTPQGGSARLGFGVLDVFLDEGTVLEFTRLDDDVVQLRLAEGRVVLRLPAREGLPGVEADTAEGRFTPQGPGSYRLERLNAASGARSQGGRWLFRAGSLELRVPAGQRLDVWRHQGRSEHAFTTATEDAWDAALRRAETGGTVAAAPAQAADIPGVDELQAHGRWVAHPEHGQVWEPRSLPPGWSPFHHGQWVWVSPWGWAWVDDMPWGFAPFHYGHWVQWRSRWVWAPGPRQPRPIFHPRPPEIWRVSPSPKLQPPTVAPPPGRHESRPPRERDVKPPHQQNPRPPKLEARPGPEPTAAPAPGLRSQPVPPPAPRQAPEMGPKPPAAQGSTPPGTPHGPATRAPAPGAMGSAAPAVRAEPPRAAPAPQEKARPPERQDRPERRERQVER